MINSSIINKIKSRLETRLDSQTLDPREEIAFLAALLREEAIHINAHRSGMPNAFIDAETVDDDHALALDPDTAKSLMRDIAALTKQEPQ